MNNNFYTKLAASNLKKNSKTYMPYMLAAIFCIAMFYIMYMLSRSSFFVHNSLSAMLWFGNIIIAIFSVIFLFYTNSFLIKRRKMEFGLFNVLGMDKRHIAKVISLETLYTAGICIVLGICTGVLFSRLIYLILGNIINFKLDDEVSFLPEAAVVTALLFAVIFILTLINSLRLIHLSKPIELLKGGQKGEREPKTKFVLTVIGLVSLGLGYYISINIKNPLEAFLYFFVAVLLVIIGTYCLFASISIFVLKMLKKNKKYYYKTSHFISVSSMMYRMKQNAVGLANICILSTIVLVTISTTVSLYAGVDDIMDQRYPKQMSVEALYSEETSNRIDNIIDETVNDFGYQMIDEKTLRYFMSLIVQSDDRFEYDTTYNSEATRGQYKLAVVPLEDFNKLLGRKETLDKDDALVYTNRKAYSDDKFKLGDKIYNVKETGGTQDNSKDAKTLASYLGMESIDSYYIVVDNMDQVYEVRDEAKESDESDLSKGEFTNMNNISRVVKFDTDAPSIDQIEICASLHEVIAQDVPDSGSGMVESRAEHVRDFYSTYGGLLFIGLYLGILFLMATILIIYYKQISEGYEDKERFRIMQNVGLTKKEVRKAIRSQILTMFFMPLILACIHISFAFPMISKLLLLFNLNNTSLFMVCMLICVAAFSLLYVLVYALTSRLYYKIVEEQ